MAGYDNKPQRWWFEGDRWFNFVAGAISIVGWVAQVFISDKTASAILNLFVIICLIAALFGLAYYRWRRERYAEVTPYLEAIAETCRKARGRLLTKEDIENDDSKFRDDLQHIMNDIANIFSILRGTRCRCALKTFYPLEDDRPEDDDLSLNEWCVQTLARDSASSTANKNTDEARSNADFDTLDKNPHLLRLFSDQVDGEDWECFENIPRMISKGQYISSSQLWHMNRTHAAGARSPSHRLPYQSALIALVCAKGASLPLGFIGVDTPEQKGFISRHDGPLLVAIAGLLGPLLDDAWALLNDDGTTE